MIALVDADGFFASCELSRNPQLRGKPVMVLGKLGSFILAKTQEAKLRGVTTVMPYKEAKRLCPEGIFIEGDFRFYTLVSRQLMGMLKDFCPLVEVTSIDEAYMDLSGLPEMHGKSHEALGDILRQEVTAKLGITVSIGIAGNKVLAKMACTRKKPNGTSVLLQADIQTFLTKEEVGDIPGIGHRREQLVSRYGIRTAADLANLPLSIVKSLFGRNGLLLWKELHGEYMFRVNPYPRVPKQIGRTSSFQRPVSDPRQLEGLAFFHLERSLESLHRHKLMTGEIILYLRDYDLKTYRLACRLDKTSDDFFVLARALSKLMRQVPKARLWRSAGVLFHELQSAEVKQLDLFEGYEKMLRDERLNTAKDQLNAFYGQFAVTSASSLFYGFKKKTAEQRLGRLI